MSLSSSSEPVDVSPYMKKKKKGLCRCDSGYRPLDNEIILYYPGGLNEFLKVEEGGRKVGPRYVT